MFTGLIQALGIIQRVDTYCLQVSWDPDTSDLPSNLILKDLALGDSVAVDGVCLTVVGIQQGGFIADVSPETLSRTTIGHRLSLGETVGVNLEASLKVGSSLGGHFVTGHIDGLGVLQGSEQTAGAWEMAFTVAEDTVARYIVPKGSIAVNGISLTVADCSPAGDWFKVAVIPHTYWHTNLCQLKAGNLVNLEGDILGKYVEKLLRVDGKLTGRSDRGFSGMATPESLTEDFLAEHGYG